jgi:drug/metabolite transporter (DMT)-like permease
LLIVYVFWGSTYLAIAKAIETIPPFFMAGSRFAVAGVLLYIYMRVVKGERVTKSAWLPASIMGLLLLVFGNGGVVFAEQYVPSGVAALLVGCGPFWFALLAWLWLKGARPGWRTVSGLIIGFIGLATLIGPGQLLGGVGHTPLVPSLVVIGAAFSWSVGSIYSKTLRLEASPMMMSALQMLAGAVMLMLVGMVTGEHRGFRFEAVSGVSLFSWAYLVVIGSLAGFSAYIYVLRHATPAVASTYAYVNPVVAVFFGWAVGGEKVTEQTLLAASLIIGAVVLISWPGRKPAAAVVAEEDKALAVETS